MAAIEFIPMGEGFTLVVGAPGIYSQRVFIILGAGLGFFAAIVINSVVMHPPAGLGAIMLASGLGAAALACVAAGIHRAYRRVVFSADGRQLAIALRGPLGRSSRTYPRQSLEAALIAVKDAEHAAYQRVISSWEREHLLLNV